MLLVLHRVKVTGHVVGTCNISRDQLSLVNMPQATFTLCVLFLLCSRVFTEAKHVSWAADEPQVQAWTFVTPENDAGVLKRWSAQRVAECGTQVGQ